MSSPSSSRSSRKPIQPLRAWRAIRHLLRDPDDTAKVFEIIDALSGNAGERSFQRFRSTPTGRRILAEDRRLLDALGDHDRLMALPAGTLGRTYAEFVAREKISGDGLAAASQTGRRPIPLDPERVLFYERLRDMHDLWHVATGYGRDLVGEAALLAFSYAQTRNRGVGFIVAVAWLRSRGEMAFARELIAKGYRRGRAAAWLELGAEIIKVESTSVSKAIIEQASERKITTICVGKPHLNLFKIILATNVFNELLKKLTTNNIDLVILS